MDFALIDNAIEIDSYKERDSIKRMRLVLPFLVVLSAISLSGAEESEERYEKFMDRSRKIFETNHMVVDVRLSSYDHKIPPAECHYDRYFGKVERIRLPDGATFARKEGGKWLESDDWGESGKPLKVRVRTS